jgi:GNAT superfamily N-acetyltransferase
MLQIREIAAGESLRRFVDVAWQVNAGDPNWVPPLRTSLNSVLDRKKHPFHRHAEVAYFLAERGDEPVGRIAAVVNHRHNEFCEEKTGFFGFFEAENDPEAARALVDAAAAWLRQRGMERIRGPLSFSTNEEMPVGVLVTGFESAPFIMTAHNPPYYDTLLRSTGLEKVRDVLAYLLKRSEAPERWVRGVERVSRRAGVTVRSLDMRRFDREIATIKAIYNSAWQRNWGFVPMTDAEFDYIAKEFKPFVDPDLCLIAEVGGEPVGFCLALPDLNEILQRIPNGRLFPTGIFKLLLGRRKIRGVRMLTLGFREGFQHLGLGTHLYLRGWQNALDRGYSRGEASWILEDNLEMRRAMENLAGEPYKRFRIYEREL